MQQVDTMLLVLAVLFSSAVHASAGAKRCGDLPKIVYGTFPKSCKTSVPGTVCAAVCESGHEVEARPSVTCRSDGKWSAPSIQCHGVCTGLPTAALPNGAWPQACKNIRHESWCQGRCNAGWHGSPKVMCTKSWKGAKVEGTCANPSDDTGQDVNACALTPCTNNKMGDVTCIDKPPPHVGDRHVRVCECRPGYTYSEEGGCHLAHVPHDDDNTDNDNHGHHDDVHDLDDDNDDLEHDAKIGIDACKTAPCTDNSIGSVTCTDKPSPSRGGADGRTCTCGTGYVYVEDKGCTDVNACLAAPCHQTARCFDKAAPFPDSADGRECICKLSGQHYINDTSGCLKVNGCAGSPCGSIKDAKADSCQDLDAPHTGFTCDCDAGYEWRDMHCEDVNACAPASGSPCISVVGSTRACADEAGNADPPYTCACETGRIWNPASRECDDIDACKETPCLSDTAGDVTCVDELPPALGVASGRTCTCGTGYVYVEGKGCTDVNACLAAPCHETARCFDKAALEPDSGDGRECICKSNEQIYENDTVGCQEVNGCADSPCGSIENAKAESCQNKGAPLAGFTCGCDAGYEWRGRQCVDVNACAPPSGTPCISVVGSTGACADETGDADPPYTCACETGRIWNPSSKECDDIDACILTPCISNTAGDVTCADEPPPALGTFSGRTCTCGTSYVYVEGKGCADINACLAAPCHKTAKCFQKAAPEPNSSDGRECICKLSGQFYQNDTVGCQDVNGCADSPCSSIQNAIADSCQDLGAPLSGFACRCEAGYEWGGKHCEDVNACAPPSGNPCISVVGSTRACADETGDADPPYTCACETGRIWIPEFRQCDDTDACIIAPCISNTAGNVTCVDQPPPALGIASGRICTCDTGYVYLEGKGCAAFECIKNGDGGSNERTCTRDEECCSCKCEPKNNGQDPGRNFCTEGPKLGGGPACKQ